MAINFPNPATLNQTYTVGTKTWVYNGYAWDLVLANTSPILNVATSAFGQANAAYAQANTGITIGQVAFNQANIALTVGQTAFTQANSAFTQANVALTTGQSAFTQANSAFTQANVGIVIGQSAFAQANVGYNQANVGIVIGQSAFAQANAAYNKANTGGSGLLATAIKTSNYAASINDLVRCNTASGAFSVTFPATPTDGGIIGVIDIAGTFAANNLTILPNGNKIESDSTSLILDLNNTYVAFVYSTATTNWRLLETPQGTGPTPTPTLNANYTAAVNDIVRCNTAGGAFSVTFPASPFDGSIIKIVDVAGTFNTNNLTVNRGGSDTIESDTSVILDINGTSIDFMYNTATTNWRLLSTPTTITSNGSFINSGNPTNINGLLSGNGSTLSAVTLKTINGNSLIGSGDITVTGGGGSSGLETNFLLMGA